MHMESWKEAVKEEVRALEKKQYMESGESTIEEKNN